MKVLFITGVLVVSLMINSAMAQSGDKDFSGIIVYNITYSDDDMDPQMMAMMPKTMKMKIKGEKSRTEISLGMGTTIAVFNGEDKSGFTLMDMMGQKYAMTMTADELEKEIEEGPEEEVIVTDETKEIAGYKCKKAVVKLNDKDLKDDMEMIVYFTEELGSGMLNYNNPMFKDVAGVMMEYTIKENNMNMTFTAISVTKKKIPDDEFEIPEGYNIMTKSEFQSMFGGH